MISISPVRTICADVEGHALAKRFFAAVIARDQLSHAYLLVGIDGIGKRACAEGVAQALFCPRLPEIGCGHCPACRAVAGGTHTALTILKAEEGKRLEIGAVRELNPTLQIRTSDRRVVILDDADRLADEAANALLKILEEPPPGVVFLLITSRPAQLLPTIASRCQRVPFAGLEPDEFERVLARLGAAVGGWPELYSTATGSPGRALRFINGIAALGEDTGAGRDRLLALMDGHELAESPERLSDALNALPGESKKQKLRALLGLLADAYAGHRVTEPLARIRAARRALAVLELDRDLDINVNSELVVERLAVLLRG
ncbi:MAG: DNA polymerase III subunit [Planctomycetota bacterium]